MKNLALLVSLFRPCAFTLGVSFVATVAFAQSPATGTIQGRVFDAGRGEYLERARLTIEGTTLEAFTDSAGQYQFTGVPAGAARVKVFFTGLPSQTTTVNVISRQIVVSDVTMSAASARTRTADEAVKLAEFVVGVSKEMDGAAIAINTQRFANNIMNVVAADEFGPVVDGTPGEVLKFLPGITLEYGAGEARTVVMNGVPATNVPITVGGFDLASAAGNSASRVTNLDQFSVNNLARIEVNQSPTPESPGSALAGSVNMVPRSAFERSRPVVNFSAFIMMKDGERSFHKTGGPMDQPTRKVTPGYNFSAVVPVNKRFGFTLSGNYADQYSYENIVANAWRGAGNATNAPAANGTPGAFPDTTSDNPYLTDFNVRDSTRDNRTYSLGFTADYKPARNDTLSLSIQYTFAGVLHNNRTLSFFVNRVLPGNWGPTFTRGAAGAGEIRTQGQAQDWLGTTDTSSLVWRHHGPIWRAEAGAGYSGAGLHMRDIDKGWFGATQARRTGVTVSYADIFYLRPNTITVTDAAGAPVDPYNLNNYALASADDHPRDSYDTKRSVFATLRRDFSVREVPVTLKGGVEMKSSERDLRGTITPFTFWGQDQRASTTPVGSDDAAGIVLDEVFSQRVGPFGFPKIQWIDHDEYYRLYRAHPEYFQPLSLNSNQNSIYRSQVDLSKYAREIISSAYLRVDAAFFNRRLQFVGGLRAEQTNIKAQGPLTDPTGNYLRDASGAVVPRRDASGNILRGANGLPLPTLILPATDAYGVSRLTYLDRGQHTEKEYLRLFPNLNVSFNLRENFIARAAYYQSVGRPSFDQYAGGLTLPDTENPASSSNIIRVNNAAIKAWSAQTVKVRLEYYFARVGQVSVGAFRREFTNFFGSTTFNATPEFLNFYNLDTATYDTFDVVTNQNISDVVRMSGLEFDYKQALTFLPDWARGVQVFANANTLHATGGDAAANFAGFVPRSGSWGVSLTRPKYGAKLNWNYRDAQRRGLLTGRGIAPNTYIWGAKRLYLDVNGEYFVHKRFAVFGNLRNIGGTTEDTKAYGPDTPSWARFRTRSDFGPAWTFGIKGSF